MKLNIINESIDRFYPYSQTMNSQSPIWQIHMLMKLENHLENAKRGDDAAESKLINRIGQLRRNCSFDSLNEDLVDSIKKSIKWLRSVGRTIDLTNDDPSKWISRRSGSPRWY